MASTSTSPGPSGTVEAIDASTEKVPVPRGEKDLYAVVWRWHFYAGLYTAPVMWILAITGALYTFRTELTELRDRSLLQVTPQGERMSYTELRQIAAAHWGSDDFEAIGLYPEENRSVHFVGHQEGEDRASERHTLIYLNPYTGDVLGTQVQEEDFFHIVLQLHRNLLLGQKGRYIVEVTTCWGVILMFTGVYLWWPRGKSNVRVWVPRIRGKLYTVLRDWHAVGGFYLVPLMVIVLVSGLFFSPVLGLTFNNTVKKVGHWPVKEWFAPPESKPAAAGAVPISLDEMIPAFLAHARPGDTVRIRFAEDPGQAHRAFMIQGEDKNSYRSVDVDQYTGEVLKVVDPEDLKFGYRVRLWAVSTHMGQIFGMSTKVLAFIATVFVFVLSFTGIWMWWKRRPAGRSGFPRRAPSGSLPLWGWGIVVLTGIVMPTAGVSFLLAAIVDTLWKFRSRRPGEVAGG